MTDKQKQLTPFEQAEVNRRKGMKRLAGIIITMQWMERKKELRQARQKMPPMEKIQWDALLQHAVMTQKQHFGYDA